MKKASAGEKREVAPTALSEKMLETIRNAILRGTLYPGEHLSQSNLAERHSVSKVPVREALKQLHTEGLLTHDRNRGYFVSRPSREEARQLYRMRRWLEAELLRTARWPDETELRTLHELQAVIEQPIAHDNREAWLDALSRLRFTIFGLSTEKTVLREAHRLWVLTDRFRALLPAHASPSGERALVDALAARDRDRLLKAHADDRDRIEALLEEALEQLPSSYLEE